MAEPMVRDLVAAIRAAVHEEVSREMHRDEVQA